MNGSVDVTTMNAAFAAARDLPSRRVAMVRSLRVRWGGGLACSRWEDRWCERDADLDSVIQMIVDVAP